MCRRRRNKLDEQNGSEQARHILRHGSITAAELQQIAKTIQVSVGTAGNFPIFIYSPDHQCHGAEDDQGIFSSYTQYHIANDVSKNCYKETHPHMSGKMQDLLMVGQRVRKNNAKTNNTC